MSHNDQPQLVAEVSASQLAAPPVQEAGSLQYVDTPPAPALLYTSGPWRPGTGPPTMPKALNRPTTVTNRPVSAVKAPSPAKGPLRPTSARIPSLPRQDELYDESSLFRNAALNSIAVEERALGQEIHSHAYALPEQTGSQRMRPMSASFFSSAYVGTQSALAGFQEPLRSLTAYNPDTGSVPITTTSVPLSPSPTARPPSATLSRTQPSGLVALGASSAPTSPHPMSPSPHTRDPLLARWGPASGTIGHGRPASGDSHASSKRAKLGQAAGSPSVSSGTGGSARPGSAVGAASPGTWGKGPPRTPSPPSTRQHQRTLSGHARLNTSKLPQPTTTVVRARPFSATAPCDGHTHAVVHSRPKTASPATQAPPAGGQWAHSSIGNYSSVEDVSRPGTAMGRALIGIVEDPSTTSLDHDMGLLVPAYAPTGPQGRSMYRWSSGLDAELAAATAGPPGVTVTTHIPKKFFGSERPISAFSAASAAARTAGATNAMGALVPQGKSVAEQPVHNAKDGSLIATSDDVINYFTQHGHSAHKKLFYLNKAKATSFYDIVSPFDLVVVPAEGVEQEYWTMSVMGVVHVTVDDKEGEFMELGEWMRLQSVYGILRKLRFFKHFKLYKAFTTWRATAKRINYHRIREQIKDQLFGAVPTFQPYLLKIQSIVHDIKSTPLTLINTRADKLYTLEEFMDEQDKHRERTALPVITAKVAQIVSLLLEVSSLVEGERIKAEGMTDIQKLKENNFVVGMPSMPAKVKAISISTMKAQQQQLVDTYQRICREMGRLKALMRLADYMVAEAFIALAIHAAADINTWFEEPKLRGCFNTTIAFDAQGGYLFAPTKAQVLEGLQQIISQSVEVTANLPRPLSSKAVSAKYMLQGEQVLDVLEVATETPHFAALREACVRHVESSYEKAQEYVFTTFEDKRMMEHFRLTWSAATYEASDPDLQTMRRDLLQQRRWGRQVEQMKMSNTVGILFVDSKKMRALLHECTQSTVEAIKSIVLQLARKCCANALEQARSWSRELEARPADLDGYAIVTTRYQEMDKTQEALFQGIALVDDMYDTYKEYGGKVDLKENVQLDNLHEAASELRVQLGDMRDWLMSRHAEMVQEMQTSSEKLVATVMGTLTDMGSTTLNDPETDMAVALAQIADLEVRVSTMEGQAEQFSAYQKLLEQPQEDYGSLQHVRREFDRRKTAWTTLSDWVRQSHAWLHDPVTSLNSEAIQTTVDECFKNTYKMCKMYREDAVIGKAKDLIDSYKAYLPLFAEVANPAMQAHHWSQVYSLLGVTVDPASLVTVQDLISWGILGKMEALSNISTSASKEFSLRKALAKMKQEWDDKEFYCIPYKDSGTCVIGQTDEIQMMLDDQLMKVQAMNASPFVKPFKQESTDWEKTLQFLQDLIDIWISCQSTWMYLQPIFSSEDIIKQMPEEGSKFSRVDTSLRALMEEVQANPACIPLTKDPERLDALREADRLLEEVQKGLVAYLEKKRLFFPRFFFLSNDEMLEILSETKDPTRVQPHLRKCFEGIHKLKFENASVVSAMTSVEGEVVPFKTVINTAQAKGAVERWLLEVEERMFDAVHDVTSRGIAAYPTKPRDQWALDWPGMVVLVVAGLFWTHAVERALSEGAAATQKCESQCTQELMQIVDLVRGELTGLQRATLGALVVMDVHARDVVASLVTERVEGVGEFAWQAQLRTYWEKPQTQMPGTPERSETVMMRMMSSIIEYGYEYLGNSSRLVITPLTDRCYRTLMGAIHMTLGGAPEGPAGTGKTETTKDLAKALARQCVVFNCSDSLDYIAMGKFFKGLAASGAWACFDEFNRIDLEVLSVVAQQVMDIQRAIAAKLVAFTFEGTDMQLRWSAWCSITMNPGYAGRSELPDNLKALFRTVAMMVPDYAMIAEIMLFSYGYLKARECSKKIVQCYKLCSEQLSSQDHYDYGMRAVMAVLRAAGNLKRRFPAEDEYVLMLRSIMDVNLCKFLSHDVPLFKGIISDLFPGVELPPPDYNLMNTAIRDACATMNLQPTEYFTLKTIQLYEMIVVRHGLMLVGLPFSGKTASYRVLASALTLMNERGQEEQQKAQYYVVNPKSITMGQLYGQFDPVSHEWSDGVLAVVFRKAASDPSPNRKWLVLDGPVDAIWIENMNTVLDDNKKLCLNSGEIIQMSPQMNMIFEVADLAVASPATVSRCGMVYLEPHQLGTGPLLTSWLQSLPTHYPEWLRQRLEALHQCYTVPLVRFVVKEVKEASPSPDACNTVALMRLWGALTLPVIGTPELFRKVDPAKLKEAVDALFIFALIYAVGGTAGNSKGRADIAGFLRAMLHNDLASYQSPAGHSYYMSTSFHVDVAPGAIPPPLAGQANGHDPALVYDWMYDMSALSWKLWTDLIPAEALVIPPTATYKSITVPTADTQTIAFLLQTALDARHPLLVVGPTGTGKTVTIQSVLMKLDPERFTPPNFIGFSAQTSANMTQALVDAKLDKRRKGVYGPPMGKVAVVFVDDLNMPQPEVYGAQPPIELLRQHMDHGGWYDRDNTFRTMQDVQFVAAMGLPGGGRSFITSRYLRHFHCWAVTEASPTTLKHIFATIQAWFYSTHRFPDPVTHLRDPLISATLDVYQTVASTLLPTPSKSHYLFNLRDLSRVVQGVQMQLPASLSTDVTAASGTTPAQQHVKLWIHEVLRVFYDRLVDPQEQEWFLDTLRSLTSSHFHMNLDSLLSHVTHPHGETKAPGSGAATSVTTQHLRRFFYGDYMSDMDETGVRPYQAILNPEGIISRMEEYLMDFNSLSKRPMNLAMFLYAVEHISRMTRVLRQEGGHMLCAGVGGSGRQSLARLASFIAGMEVFQVEISRNYGLNEWREDLKRYCRRAGADNKPCVFLFSDTQIKAEAFVEDINNLLNSGEVPNMFPYDERAGICEAVRNLAKKQGLALDSPAELWAFFVQLTKANLHLVLCFSPIGNAFRDRLRQFPSLINCCTIDWFQPWPEDALEAVAVKFLKEVDVTATMRTSLMGMCKTMHTSVEQLSKKFKSLTGRHNYVTPTSYLELISMFTTLLAAKRTEVLSAQQRYEVGLDKLEFTAQQVEAMRKELRALKPVLQKTVAETEHLMSQIAREKAEVVEPKKAIVDAEVKAADVKAQEARAIKEECEGILAEALPALNASIAALDTIKKADIQLVQSFKNPPAAVKLVMEAVCVLLDAKPTMVADPNMPGKKIADYWDVSKKLLMDSSFIIKLKEYDRDNIPSRLIDKVRKEYTSDEEFTPANAAKASSAAEGLCKWVHAMDSYDKVAKIVAPKRASLKEAESAYATVLGGLKAKQAELAEVLSKLATLEADLAKSVVEKERLESEVELCALKLDRAEQLISGLGGEKDRWTEAANMLRLMFHGLTGDVLVSAAVIGYLGAFTAPYREEAVAGWITACKAAGIQTSSQYKLSTSLGDPVKIREWVIAELPNDTFSIDNAIMLTNARRWPLCIDPQKQANKWIKNMEAARRLVVMKLTDSDYMRVLENAIQFGLPVLLENVGEELDPSLEPVLLKQIFKQAGVQCLKLGDSVVEYNDSFRFYITTALRNPHYLPETAVKVTLLNFMITQEGLADQLLGVVVAQEMPDLEEQRQLLVVSSAENKRRLKEIEDQILHVLSSSSGNILEDASAVQILNDAKKVSDDISNKQAVAEETQTKIDAARKGYRPCGDYNAVLFFCIADLAGVDSMYQYSLSWFIALFQRSIANSPRSDLLGRRLDAIAQHFTYSLYNNICRSLFEKDKILFSLLLSTRILRHQKKLPAQEYEFLVTGGANMPAQTDVPNPDPAWISDANWEQVLKMAMLCDSLTTLPGQIALATGAWRAAMRDSLQPHKETLPDPYDKSLTPFQKLLLVKALRPDKLVPAVATFVSSSLGQNFTEPPLFDLAGAFAESSSTTPLLFVLSPGSDPTAALLSFAESRGQSGGKLQVISMGQGQGPKAAALIEDARGLGTWVLLQNCHLAPSWMSSLERIIESLSPDNTDDKFRLWMTSMPSAAFPPSILQVSVKITNEPPEGLKANMRRCLALEPLCEHEFWEPPPPPLGQPNQSTHSAVPALSAEDANRKASAVKRLLFGLVFIHAFVQERRRFGPIGWNIPYGFDDGDLRISARQVRMYVLANKEVPFAALQYAIGECNYGGRVTDDKDRRLLTTLMAKIYCTDLTNQAGFSLSESGLYVVPPDGPLGDYVSAVESLPSTQAPEVFGLAANADTSRELTATSDLLSSLLASGGGGGVGSQDAQQAAAVADQVRSLLSRLPPDFDLEAAGAKYVVSYSQSMNQVLCQEMARYNRLLGVIRTSLVNLDKALAGLQVMSSDLEGVLQSMALGRVPPLWKKTSYPSLKPLGSYMNDLLARLHMLQHWYEHGAPPAFWVSGFFFTPSFITAVLQNYARAHKLPIDSVGFEFAMLRETVAQLTQPPTDGCYIHGLFLEGCGWDPETQVLAESQPKVLHVAAPVMWLRPVQLAQLREVPAYECPVYRTGDRRGTLATTGHSTNFLMMIRMPSLRPAAHWIMRGVCMLCSLSD